MWLYVKIDKLGNNVVTFLSGAQLCGVPTSYFDFDTYFEHFTADWIKAFIYCGLDCDWTVFCFWTNTPQSPFIHASGTQWTKTSIFKMLTKCGFQCFEAILQLNYRHKSNKTWFYNKFLTIDAILWNADVIANINMEIIMEN